MTATATADQLRTIRTQVEQAWDTAARYGRVSKDEKRAWLRSAAKTHRAKAKACDDLAELYDELAELERE